MGPNMMTVQQPWILIPTLPCMVYLPTFTIKMSTIHVGKYTVPWEPTTFIFRGYNPYIGGSTPSFFMVLGSKGA